jgi:DNA mismatch repair protein MutS
VQVARLAGMPPALLRQARATLESLEAERIARQPQSDLFSAAPAADAPPAAVEESAFAAAWRALDPDMLTPREALDALYRLKALQAPNLDPS